MSGNLKIGFWKQSFNTPNVFYPLQQSVEENVFYIQHPFFSNLLITKKNHLYFIEIINKAGELIQSNGDHVYGLHLQIGGSFEYKETLCTLGYDNELPKVNFSNRIPALESKNEKLKETFSRIPLIAANNYPVLILGPTGSGKEGIAQVVHELSLRSKESFVKVNCSALTETLIESELFGHVKGSFTGAICNRQGAFESAKGGTLFLDEIGDLPYSVQSKLLRAIENQEIRPVGSDKTTKIDCRIIAATHKNLIDMIKQGTFRDDLYYRLNAFIIKLPALKDRKEDFDFIFFNLCRTFRVRFTSEAISFLKNHHAWSGNIRELKNVILRASILFKGKSVSSDDLPTLLDQEDKIPALEMPDLEEDLQGNKNILREIERKLILNQLKIFKGNQRKTSMVLGIPKSTLHDKIKTYGIDIQKILEV